MVDTKLVQRLRADITPEIIIIPGDREAALKFIEELQAYEPENIEAERAEWEELKQALDEDRLSSRKLFP